jgi:deazaflavin-dependent oxidoreductase (nitroreductase family)
MSLEGEYEPSPWSFAADQVELYEKSGGTEGTVLQGAPVVILTTRGRRTGKIRKSPLMRVEHDGTYAVVASLGGAPKHPVWYYNLVANPDVMLRDGPAVHELTARETTGAERDEWWKRATDAWPSYDDYQAKTERVIPVFLLEPRS